MISIRNDILPKSLKQMEENAYANISILEKSTANPLVNVFFEDINLDKIFKRGYNKNAKYVYFTLNNEKYIRFSVAMNLNSERDFHDRKHKNIENIELKYYKVSEHGQKNRNNIDIFVDGIKVPDEEVLITLLSGSTDIYVPQKYFLEFVKENHRMLITLSKYNLKKKYLNYYTKYNSGTTIEVPFLVNKEVEINKDYLRFYVNGRLKNNYRVLNSGTIDISEMELEENDIIEICYKWDSVYYGYSSNSDIQITFPNSVMIKKTIPIDIYEGYNNGLRLYPKDLKQVTPRIIEIENDEFGFEFREITNYVTYDMNALPVNKYHYIDDLTQFFNFHYEDIVAILTGTYEGYIPDYIQNIEFPPEVIDVFNTCYQITHQSMNDFLVDKLKEYIELNAENFKYYLNNNIDYSRFYYFYRNDLIDNIRTDTSVELGSYDYHDFNGNRMLIPLYRDDERKYNAFVLVDGKLIPLEENIVIPYRNHIYVYSPIEYFENEYEQVRVILMPIVNENFFKITPISAVTEIELSDNLTNFQSYDDIVVMKARKFPPDYERNYHGVDGWVLVDYTYEYNELLNKVIVTIENYDSSEEYIIYNGSFTDNVSYTLTSDYFEGDHPVRIYYDKKVGERESGTDIYDVMYPMVSKYIPLVFVNNELLINNLDYEIVSQYNNKDRCVAHVIFKRELEVNDVVTIYRTEGFYESLGSCDYIYNKYGIILLDDLPIPYDTTYLDLIVNGRRVDPSKIEIISTNLIRVKDFDEIKNVQIISKLGIPIRDLSEYTTVFKENPSLWHEYIKKYWSYRLNSFYEKLNSDAKLEFDNFYSYFWYYLNDETNKNNIVYWLDGVTTKVNRLFWNIDQEDNDAEILPTDLVNRINLISNEFMVLIVEKVLSHLIDCNIFYNFSDVPTISEVMTDGKNYVDIDANKKFLMRAISLNCNVDCLTPDEMEYLIIPYIEDKKINIYTRKYDIPADDPLWENIYPAELDRYLRVRNTGNIRYTHYDIYDLDYSKYYSVVTTQIYEDQLKINKSHDPSDDFIITKNNGTDIDELCLTANYQDDDFEVSAPTESGYKKNIYINIFSSFTGNKIEFIYDGTTNEIILDEGNNIISIEDLDYGDPSKEGIEYEFRIIKFKTDSKITIKMPKSRLISL